LIVQSSVKSTIKVFDDIVDLKLADPATTLVEEAADGLGGDHSRIPSIDPGEAAVRGKLSDLG
jgi:hypothetical protein